MESSGQERQETQSLGQAITCDVSGILTGITCVCKALTSVALRGLLGALDSEDESRGWDILSSLVLSPNANCCTPKTHASCLSKGTQSLSPFYSQVFPEDVYCCILVLCCNSVKKGQVSLKAFIHVSSYPG